MSDTIVFATAERCHIPLLKELWLKCFPDDLPKDVDRFYDTLFSSMICLIGTVDDRPVTMLHLLPARAFVRGASFPVRYLYAGCTHPDHRHRGYYAALLRNAQKCVEGMGECGIYLHPATEQLISLYAQAGYTSAIASGVPRPLRGDETPMSLSAEDYAKLRWNHIQQLQSNFVYFEPETAISKLFIAGLLCEGISLYSGNDRILLVRNGMVIDSLPPETTTYHTAMWIETGEERQLTQSMNAHGGYTALLGE